ncbi:MAG: hypothetical protein JKX75_00775, partial [Gammaproteobacteria bacterium]|nr:hypothetical protein [Gammaproteobacteria bacterium]
DGIDKYIFVGDILFVGDMARPDLLGKENINDLAEKSYQTAMKLYNLDNDLMTFTSHIKGSFCGKNLKTQYFSTIGIEKKTNYSFMLSKKGKKEYINNLINQNIETPLFFHKMTSINIEGPKLLNSLSEIRTIDEEEFFDSDFNNSYIIDLRHPNYFRCGHIKNSINIYEESNVSLISGNLLEHNKNIYLIGDDKSSFNKFVTKLRRVGFDNIEGILDFNINNLPSLKEVKQLQSDNFVTINLNTHNQILNAINIEISDVTSLILDLNKMYKVTCKNGYKSMSVVSFLLLNNKNVYVL